MPERNGRGTFYKAYGLSLYITIFEAPKNRIFFGYNRVF